MSDPVISGAVAGSSIPHLGANIMKDVRTFLAEQNLQLSARDFSEMEMTFRYHEITTPDGQPGYQLVTNDSKDVSEGSVQEMKVYLKEKQPSKTQ